jgi:transcriptional regulator with XRE-family HTH domain
MEQTTGDLLREARKDKGWTQEEFADRIGTSTTTVSNWERGVTAPGLEDINVVASALSLSPDVLLLSMGVILTPPAASRLPRELIEAALELTPEELGTLTKVAKGLLASQPPHQRNRPTSSPLAGGRTQ